MFTKIKTLLASTAVALLLAVGALPVLTVGQAGAADVQVKTFDSSCKGANLDLTSAAGGECDNNDSAARFNNLIARIINAFSIIVGAVAVVMIIIGGFRYVTSGGESSNISSAKNTILYALIGLVIVVFAQFIVKFVLAKATGGTESATVNG